MITARLTTPTTAREADGRKNSDMRARLSFSRRTALEQGDTRSRKSSETRRIAAGRASGADAGLVFFLKADFLQLKVPGNGSLGGNGDQNLPWSPGRQDSRDNCAHRESHDLEVKRHPEM